MNVLAEAFRSVDPNPLRRLTGIAHAPTERRYDLSETEKKPEKILIEVTIPTKDQVVEGIKGLFPTVKVRVIGDEKDEENVEQI